jgi:beta-galactosidase
MKASSGDASHGRVIEVVCRSHRLDHLDSNPLKVNVGSHCDFMDPLTGEVWIADQPYSGSGWGYQGGTIYQRSKNKFQGTPINILGTENDPLFQTMREDIQSYRFDVGQGTYLLTMLFAEPDPGTFVMNNLSVKDTTAKTHRRIFSIQVNGQNISPNLDLANQYGPNRAVQIAFEVFTREDLLVTFEKIQGKPVLSGIKLERK